MYSRKTACLSLIVLVLSGCSLLKPKEDLPAKSAMDYYTLGIRYKQMGRTELSREMLNKAIELDPEGNIGSQALLFQKTMLPLYPVSREHEQRNAIGYNQLAHGDRQTARKTFEDLMRDAPNFEWPYLNLAMLHMQSNEPDTAEELLNKALAINPNYLKAWSTLAKVKQMRHDEQGFKTCMEKLKSLETAEGLIEK